ERAGADPDVEALLDEIDRASRAKQVQSHVRIARQVLGDDRTEERDVDRRRHAQEPARRRLQIADGALRVLGLGGDARAVLVEGATSVREAELARRSLEQ